MVKQIKCFIFVLNKIVQIIFENCRKKTIFKKQSKYDSN